ncbi:MAG: CAP domain-containing protein [Patescibacteria group bacterium]
MRKHLKDYFIPHEGNEHKPHALREASVLAIALVVVLLFGFSVFQAVLVRTNNEFLASVVPAVLVDLANDDREAEGLGTLSINPVLEEAARMKAEDMAKNEYFAHTSPDGLDPWYWFYRAGYQFVRAGENLAVNFSDSHDVNRAWMDSPGHRANIMNGNFTEVGIAAVSGTYKGKKTVYVVQLFGTPAVVAEEASNSVQIESEFIPQEGAAEIAGETVAVVEPEPVVPEVAEVMPEPEPVVTLPIAPLGITNETDTYAETNEEPAPAEAPTEKTNEALVLEELMSRPRAAVAWGYMVIGLLIAFVMLLMVYRQVHRQHSRNMAYGAALLAIICLLFYFNYLLLSADLLVI